jgi:hypothetical protein
MQIVSAGDLHCGSITLERLEHNLKLDPR